MSELLVFTGIDPASGKRRYRSKTVRGSRVEAERELAMMVEWSDAVRASRRRRRWVICSSNGSRSPRRTGHQRRFARPSVLNRQLHPGIVVAATHGLLIGPACQRLADAASGIGSLLVSDSVPSVYRAGLHVEVHTVSGLLADAIGRLHSDQDMGELLVAS
jgi:hypothetical protein